MMAELRAPHLPMAAAHIHTNVTHTVAMIAASGTVMWSSDVRITTVTC